MNAFNINRIILTLLAVFTFFTYSKIQAAEICGIVTENRIVSNGYWVTFADNKTVNIKVKPLNLSAFGGSVFIAASAINSVGNMFEVAGAAQFATASMTQGLTFCCDADQCPSSAKLKK